MWYVMAREQRAYDLSERLIRAITQWNVSLAGLDEDAEELIEQGADINRPHGTLLPLHCACMVRDTSLVQLLLDHGAQLNQLDGYSRAAVHYAAEKDIDCLQILLSHGADLNITDSNQDTALHWAAFKNNHSCVKVLLQHGARVNSLDHNHDTPLSWAAMKGNLEAIQVLLEYNAQPDTYNLEGKSPLMRICFLFASGLNSSADDSSLGLLVRAMGQFDLRNGQATLPDYIREDNKLADTLGQLCESPRSLQELSRSVIRRELGQRYLPNVVPKLPVPGTLQEYLLLRR